MRKLLFVVAFASALGSIGSAAAQVYPSRPITVIVPFAAGGPLDTTGRILALVALIGAARAFEGPTMSALIVSVVSRPLVPKAMAWSVSANQAARIVSPALGGLLYVAGAEVVYFVAATLFLISANPWRREHVLEQHAVGRRNGFEVEVRRPTGEGGRAEREDIHRRLRRR